MRRLRAVPPLPLRWHAAGGTFSPEGAGHAEAAEEAQAGRLEPVRAPSPASLLLDRITEVCETRHERAKIRREDGDLPHLLITHQDGEFIRQWRVAAHVGEPTRDVLAAFLQLVHAGQPEPGSELVYQGPQPPRVLREEATRRGVRLRSFIEFQGLLDLRDYVAKQTARLAADTLYPPGLYVPQRFRELDRSTPGVRDDLVEELLRQVAANHGRFVLVLGDFGRGKTFALQEVARRIPVELPHLIPLLIELRALDKAHSVDGLVAAHLANHGEDLIDLKAFRYMLRQGRIVLLFDGFDELVTRVTYERAADHLETLLQAAEDKAKVVVASRTQHFKSHEQVFTALGERVGALPNRRVFAVEDFTPRQIRAYLVGRYDGNSERADRRLQVLGGIQDLLGLSSNPRMLSFIADLEESRLRAVAGTQQAISAAGLYEEILRAWLTHEEERTHVAGTPGGLRLDELWRAVTSLASCDSDGHVQLWNSASGQASHRLAGHKASVWPMAFRPDGRQLATTGNDGSARLWDPAGGQCRHVLRGHGRRITQVRFSQAGEQLATIGNDGVVRLWHPRTGQQLRQLTGTADRLISVLFSPAGDRLATATNDGGVYLWNAASGAYEREMSVETDHLWAEAFSPAGDILATANDDDTVRLWYCTTGRHLSTFAEHSGRVRSIAFSPDGRMLATGCDDRAVRLWDIYERACVATLTGHADRVYSVMFSPDGAVLASASNDGTARLWDVASATPIRTLARHQGRLWSAAFNSAGTMLATGGDDLAIRLWDPRSGAELRTLTGHTRRVWSVAFSPDGTLLASAGDDGTARLWDASGSGPSPLRLTLLGLPEGWAALAPDGRYKQEGDVAGQFWHAVGMSRFDPGELDSYLTAVRRLPLDGEF